MDLPPCSRKHPPPNINFLDFQLFTLLSRIQLTMIRPRVQLFQIQAVEDGPDGRQFLPDLPKPARHPAAEEEGQVAATGGEDGDDAPPTRDECREPAGPGDQSAPIDGAGGRTQPATGAD